jgi:WD40 repeat protein
MSVSDLNLVDDEVKEDCAMFAVTVRLSRVFRFQILLVFVLIGGIVGSLEGGIPIAQIERTMPVDFEKEILPVFNANCLACHNQTKSKAGLILETPKTILDGGDSGPSVLVGNPSESLLMQAAAHLDEDLVMPPVGNSSNAQNLSSEELALLQLWILQGAKGEVRGDSQLEWQPVSERVQPVYTMDLSASGRYVVYGRGSEAMVYEIPSRQHVARLIDPSLGENRTHLDLVNSIAIHPNGRLIATGGYREIKLWERVNKIETFSLKEMGGRKLNHVALSSDGLVIGASDKEGMIKIWNISTGELMMVDKGPVVSHLTLSRNGQSIAAFEESGDVRSYFIVQDGAHGSSYPLEQIPLASCWDQKGRNLGVVMSDGSMTIFAIAQEVFHEARQAKGISDARSIGFFGDGDGFFTVGVETGGVQIIDAATGGVKSLIDSIDHSVEQVAFNNQGNRMAIATGDGNGSIWDLESGKRLVDLKGARMQQHRVLETERALILFEGALELAQKESKSVKEELKKETERVAKAGEDLKTKQEETEKISEKYAASKTVYDEAKQEVAELESSVTTAKEHLATAKRRTEEARVEAMTFVSKFRIDAKGTSKSDDVETLFKEEAEKVFQKIETLAFAAGEAKAALERVNSDIENRKKAANEGVEAAKKALEAEEKNDAGSTRALTIAENELKLAKKSVVLLTARDEAAVEAIRGAETVLAAGKDAVNKAKSVREDSRDPFLSISFSPDGNRVVAFGADGSLSQWWAATGEELDHTILSDRGLISGQVLTDRSAMVVDDLGEVSVVSFDQQWRLKQTLGEEYKIADRVNALDFSHDGRRLAAGGGDPSRSGEIKVWELSTMEMTHSLSEVHSDVVFGVQFSPDGNLLATGSADRFARVIDIATQKTLHSFEGHTHYVMDVSWQANGRILVSAGGDGLAKVWDVTTGERKKNIEGFKKEVTGVGFVGDKAEVLASSGDATMAVYGLDGKKIRSLEGTKDFVFAEAVSADGRFAAAGTLDGTLRVWDVPSGKVLTTVE